MQAASMLPPPLPLDVHDACVSEKRRDVMRRGSTDVDDKSDDKQSGSLTDGFGTNSM